MALGQEVKRQHNRATNYTVNIIQSIIIPVECLVDTTVQSIVFERLKMVDFRVRTFF